MRVEGWGVTAGTWGVHDAPVTMIFSRISTHDPQTVLGIGLCANSRGDHEWTDNRETDKDELKGDGNGCSRVAVLGMDAHGPRRSFK